MSDAVVVSSALSRCANIALNLETILVMNMSTWKSSIGVAVPTALFLLLVVNSDWPNGTGRFVQSVLSWARDRAVSVLVAPVGTKSIVAMLPRQDGLYLLREAFPFAEVCPEILTTLPHVGVLEYLGAYRVPRVVHVCANGRDFRLDSRTDAYSVSDRCSFYYNEIRDLFFQARFAGPAAVLALLNGITASKEAINRLAKNSILTSMMFNIEDGSPVFDLAYFARFLDRLESRLWTQTSSAVSSGGWTSLSARLAQEQVLTVSKGPVAMLSTMGIGSSTDVSPRMSPVLSQSAPIPIMYSKPLVRTNSLKVASSPDTGISPPAAAITMSQMGGQEDEWRRVGRLIPTDSFVMTFYYRSQEWALIRPEFPSTVEEFHNLVQMKIPNIRPELIRVFSPQIVSDGSLWEYEQTGGLDVGMLKGKCARKRMYVIDVLLVDPHERNYPVAPTASLETVLKSIHDLETEVNSWDSLSLFAFYRSFVMSAAIAIRMIEFDGYQRMALRSTPVWEIHTRARKSRTANVSYEAALLQELVAWFREYYQPLPLSRDCSTCCRPISYAHTTPVGGSGPVLDRKLVERWNCCGKSAATLERSLYDMSRIWESRSGRCGEFSKAFALIARAMGFDVRIVVTNASRRDSSSLYMDHFWNEVYIDNEWVHVDTLAGPHSSVGTTEFFNAPLSYDRPGSAISVDLVAAVGHDGIVQVTRRYLSSAESFQRANKNRPEALILRDSERLDNAFTTAGALSAISGSDWRRSIHHKRQSEHSLLQRMFNPPHDDAQVGRCRAFDGEFGSISVEGGEIPRWQQLRPDHKFSSLVQLHKFTDDTWKVEAISICKNELGVTAIDFDYSQTRRQRAGAIVSAEDLAQCHVVSVAEGLFVKGLVPVIENGHIRDLHVELGTERDTGEIVGVYGSRDPISLVIDFLGIYKRI